MQDFEAIVEKLKDIISQKISPRRVLDKDVARELGIEQVNFATMKKRNKIPYYELSHYCAQNKISLNWLLFDQAPESLIEVTNRYYKVKYLKDVCASAGGGALNYDEDYELLEMSQSFVDFLGGDKNLPNIEAINVVGDSMEPTLKDGSIVFVDRQKREFKNGGVFAITCEGGVFVKRVVKRVDGRVDVLSDNRDYPAWSVHPDEFNIIGRVVASFGSVD